MEKHPYKKQIVGNRSISYLDMGNLSDPLVLYLHGISASPHLSVNLLENIAKQGFRVIAPAIYGLRSANPIPLTLKESAEVTLEFCNKIRIDPYNLVGSSIGTAVGYEMLGQDSRLSTFSALSPVLPTQGNIFTPLVKTMSDASNSKDQLSKIVKEAKERGYKGSMEKDFLATFPWVVLRVLTLRPNMLTEIKDLDFQKHQTNTPSYILYPQKDMIFPNQTEGSLKDQFSQTFLGPLEIEVMQGWNHSAPIATYPEETAQKLAKFIKNYY